MCKMLNRVDLLREALNCALVVMYFEDKEI